MKMTESELLPPLACSLAETVRVSGLGRTTIYELIATGQLRSVKRVGRRLILYEDLRRYIEHGPRATEAA